MCEMYWIAEWVQVSDLPVKVAESISCVLHHRGSYYIVGSWGLGVEGLTGANSGCSVHIAGL